MELAAGERHLDGREIYHNLCTKCHGRAGEGVKDKHDGPLQGDRSLEKLTHYIERKMPEDTGDYEFLVKSAKGVRRWVNDNEEPLIDAWVACGQVSEHKATTRLIGGRTYPLRLNLFKFKEKTGSVLLQWKPPRGSEEII